MFFADTAFEVILEDGESISDERRDDGREERTEKARVAENIARNSKPPFIRERGFGLVKYSYGGLPSLAN